MKFRERKITIEEIQFWIRVLKFFRDRGIDIDNAINILNRSLKRVGRKEKLYSVTIQKLYSKGTGVDNEVLIVNSYKLAKKLADLTTVRTYEGLEKLESFESKVNFLKESGEIGRVYNKNTKRLLYENKDLVNEIIEIIEKNSK